MVDVATTTDGRGGRSGGRQHLRAVPVPPAPRGRIAPEKLARVDQLLADPKLGRNEIARRAGVSVDTVTKRARAVGRSFDASVIRVANDARAQDGRSKRRQLAEQLLDDAIDEAKLRTEIGAADAQARANLSRSLGTLVKAVADLELIELRYRELESETKAGADVDEWLAHMAGGHG